MLWEIDVFPADTQPDVLGAAIVHDTNDLGFTNKIQVKTAYGYLIEGDFDESQIKSLAEKLLSDQIVEKTFVQDLSNNTNNQTHSTHTQSDSVLHSDLVYVLPKPGVTDSVAENVKRVMAEFGLVPFAVRTFKKYEIGGVGESDLKIIASKLLANDAVEQVVFGNLPFDRLQISSQNCRQPDDNKNDNTTVDLVTIPLRSMNKQQLVYLSQEGQLHLSLDEMQTIKTEFEKLQRDPTDIELETLAQTWSEHCSHKTLAGKIRFVRQHPDGTSSVFHFNNMLKETIFAATKDLMATNQAAADLCVSVFSDNAGIVTFDDEYNVCFKVETHNHPSALEPYGGANTGLGGVIRDPMGTGLGAKPIASTDVFCFAPPDILPEDVPVGVLHPRRVMKGVVAGVRDYGNRMGIPTVNGAVCFDKRYLGNPLVFCGNVGILPKDKSFKEPREGDLIVAIGGRTGRDGIHGATFSSVELTAESESVSGGAVQIGNAITEKMVLDVMLKARDKNLYNAVTDCGAGGFSSAVGEMGENIGAEVELSNAPLKYEGLTYTEIWISEAQERMILAVPKNKWNEFNALCESEDVEATILGTFNPTGKLILKFHGKEVANIDMNFLHKGRPPIIREAIYKQPDLSYNKATDKISADKISADKDSTDKDSVDNIISCDCADSGCDSKRVDSCCDASRYSDDLLCLLGMLNVASKHWIIRQYDHEVQGGSVIKPLVGLCNDSPSDAAVIRPRLVSRRGLVLSCGINPYIGDVDVYSMAASVIDEAIRNAISVGADLSTVVLLDNFCWGNTSKPETLGSLVEAALACYDVAVGFGTPFISGKDSLNNEFRPAGKEPISIPPTLLISAMGQIDDVANCVTMDLKRSGSFLYQVGETREEFGGSHFALLHEIKRAKPPTLNISVAKKLYVTLHEAIEKRLVLSVHDLSEGGFAVAVSEMCFAGGFGAELFGEFDETTLFSESNSRFIVEVDPKNANEFENLFKGQIIKKIGIVTKETTLKFGNLFQIEIDKLKSAWQSPLDWTNN